MTLLDRPIVIMGTGRCGSTMLHRLLALHPDVGWTSTFNEVLPRQPWLSAFSNLYRLPCLGRELKHLVCFPKPFEAYKFWEAFLPGFSRRDRPLTADDVPEEGIEPARRTLARLLRYQGRSRLLVKVTGWSRMAYFDRIFPDARFVSLRREHRAVISSWIQAGWLDVTSAPSTPGWQWGEVPPAYLAAFHDLGGGPILSAAVKIQLDLDDIRRNMALLPGRCHELDYDDLIAQPIESLRAMTDFCGLAWDQRFERAMRKMAFHDTRNKWKKFLSPAEGDLVLEFFRRVEEDSMCRVTA